MTKYLVCHTPLEFFTVGKPYEVIAETDGDDGAGYFTVIDDEGDVYATTKAPGYDGFTYTTRFTLKEGEE